MSKLLSEQEKQRLRELRARPGLDAPEATELAELLARADAGEAVVLAPQTRSVESENQARKAENYRLAALVERRQRLVNQLAESLQSARAERHAIDLELQNILQARPENRSALAGERR